MWRCICLWLKIATHPSEAFCATHAKMGRRNGRGWWQWGVQLSYEREVALHLHGLSLCTFQPPPLPPHSTHSLTFCSFLFLSLCCCCLCKRMGHVSRNCNDSNSYTEVYDPVFYFQLSHYCSVQ